MLDFTFCSPTKIIFGRSALAQVGGEVAPHAGHVLLVHTGSTKPYALKTLGAVRASLKEQGIAITELTGIVPNPRLSKVREGIELVRKENIPFILAVGGGSVIDTAKAIAFGAPADVDVWDFFTRGVTIEKKLPLGTVCTYPAAGSETSNSCVISNEKEHAKLSANQEPNRPLFAILDPEVTLGLPAKLTFAGVVDMMSHIMERYFSHTTHAELVDGMAEAMLRCIIRNAYTLLEKPDDYDARAEIMLAAALAHNNLTGIGKAQDWAAHRVGAALGALYDAVHGETLSVMTPAWATYVYKAHPEKFADFAVNVMGAKRGETEATALEGIRLLKEFYVKLGMPVTLKELGVPEDLDALADAAMTRGKFGNIVVFDREDAYKVFELAR